MKIWIISFMVSFSFDCMAQNAIAKTEQELTNGNKKSWRFFETVKTMGNRQMSSNDCQNNLLTFQLSPKTYLGKVCEGNDANIWRVEGDDPDEQYIIMDQRYMIDIYHKQIEGKQVEVLRLKKISTNKEQPTIGHIYLAVE